MDSVPVHLPGTVVKCSLDPFVLFFPSALHFGSAGLDAFCGHSSSWLKLRVRLRDGIEFVHVESGFPGDNVAMSER